MNSLRVLDIRIWHKINTEHLFNLLIKQPKIESFFFKTDRFEFFFNSLEKRLDLCNVKNEDLNFDFLCGEIEKLTIMNSKNEAISNLLGFRRFANLLELKIEIWDANKIEGKLFIELTKLQKLVINFCSNLQIIDKDSLSSLKQLVYLDLKFNAIKSIDESAFIELVNLRYLNLSCNRIESINEKMFRRLERLETLNFSANQGLNQFPYDDFLRYKRREYVFENFILIVAFQFFLFLLKFTIDAYNNSTISFEIVQNLFSHIARILLIAFLLVFFFYFTIKFLF